MIVRYLGVHFPYLGINEVDLLAAFFMLAGNLFKERDIAKTINLPIVMLGLAVMVIGLFYWHHSMLDTNWQTIIPYSLTAIIGSWLCLCASYKIDVNGNKYISQVLLFIGNNTLSILTWHFLCFKLITYIIISVYGLDIENLSAFPTLQPYSQQGWWFVYTITGVSIPLLLVIAGGVPKKYINLIKNK